MKIIDCKNLSEKIKFQLSKEVLLLETIPTLAVILVGDDAASQIYVQKKREACIKIGVGSEIIKLPNNITESYLLNVIDELNSNPNIHGILVQLPLPQELNVNCVLNRIDDKKDVDCFTARNLGMLIQDNPIFVPCTPAAVCCFLDSENISVAGKHVVIINDSMIVGRPLSLLLRHRGATITMCNQFTDDIKNISKSGDIVVVAVGKRPFFTFTEEFCKKDAIVIDVGINKLDRIVGDVSIDSIQNLAQIVTKVPGGIGLLTICMLLNNLIKAARICQLPRP